MAQLLSNQENCVAAWLEGAKLIMGSDHHEFYNLILEIDSPTQFPASARVVYDKVDDFLLHHGDQPLSTVANTIFPAGLYREYGGVGVYDIYPNKVYPKIKKPNEWGRYAMRLIQREDNSGNQMSPLKNMVEKLRSELKKSGPMRAIYELGVSDCFMELPTYDVKHDDRRRRGGPCLSHLSFKLTPEKELMLTAIYRYHYYIEKGLGNLMGLAQLQDFICSEVGVLPGKLICHSTYARIDTEGAWNLSDVKKLLDDCDQAQDHQMIA